MINNKTLNISIFLSIILFSLLTILSNGPIIIFLFIGFVGMFLLSYFITQVQFMYLSHLLMILLSFVLIPWTKQVFKVGPIQIVYIPYFLLAIFIVMKKIRHPKIRMTINKVGNLSLVLFLIYGMFSVIWVYNFTSWAVYLLQWFIYILFILFPISNFFSDMNELINYLKYHLIGLSVIGLNGLIRFFMLGYRDANPLLLFNRNGSIFLFIPFIPLILNSYDFFKKKNIYWIINFLTIGTILFVFSRTAYISFFISLLTMLMINKDRLIFKISLKKLTLTLFISLMLFLVILFIGENVELLNVLMERFKLLTDGFITLITRDSNNTYDFRRVELMTGGVDIIRNNLLIGTGIGIENYLYHFPTNITSVAARTHNIYISYLGELGLLGFIPFMFFFLSTALFYFNKTKQIKNKKFKKIGYSFFIGHINIMVALGTNEYITFPYLWLFWGIGYSFFKIIEVNHTNINKGWEYERKVSNINY